MEFAPWPYFDEDEIQAVVKVLKSGKVNQWTGTEVSAFELEFSKYIGVDYAVALANGSLALDLALAVYDIGPGDEVIVTPRTFMASVSCIALRGAIPVFADVDPVTQNITLQGIQLAVTSKTKAVIAVNLSGWPCDLEQISAFCQKRGLVLIEDCAQSHGAEYNQRKAGSFGDCSIFSFCQDKIMTTGGEGGMFLTKNKKIWEKAWSYKDHGKNYQAVFNKKFPSGFRWVVESFGTNFRMTEMQAAIGRIMIRKLDKWVDQRRAFAKIFDDAFKEIPGLRVTVPPSNIKHAYYKYYVFIDIDRIKGSSVRNDILEELNSRGILCTSGICPEVYQEKVFEHYPFRLVSSEPEINEDSSLKYLPNARRLGETSVMFMVHPTLDVHTIYGVVSEVKDVMRKWGK